MAIVNRRARHDYQLGQSLVAGLVLAGWEVRSLRSGQGSLKGAFIRQEGNELWLYGLQVNPLDKQVCPNRHKLLVTKNQLKSLKNERYNSLVPLEIKTGRYIKLVFAPGQGRKKLDKRQVLKKRDADRQIRRKLKSGKIKK